MWMWWLTYLSRDMSVIWTIASNTQILPSQSSHHFPEDVALILIFSHHKCDKLFTGCKLCRGNR